MKKPTKVDPETLGMKPKREKTQKEHFFTAQSLAAGADQTMLDLLFGKNPISDDELRRLIAKRPHVYGKYAGYLGKRR